MKYLVTHKLNDTVLDECVTFRYEGNCLRIIPDAVHVEGHDCQVHISQDDCGEIFKFFKENGLSYSKDGLNAFDITVHSKKASYRCKGVVSAALTCIVRQPYILFVF